MNVLPLPLPSLDAGDRALMHINKLANEREPDTQPSFGMPLVRANLREQLKDMRQVRRRDADAIISDAHHRPIRCTRKPAALSFRRARSILGRIRQKVRENLREAIEITFDPQFLSTRLDSELMPECISIAVRAASALLAKMSRSVTSLRRNSLLPELMRPTSRRSSTRRTRSSQLPIHHIDRTPER